MHSTGTQINQLLVTGICLNTNNVLNANNGLIYKIQFVHKAVHITMDTSHSVWNNLSS